MADGQDSVPAGKRHTPADPWRENEIARRMRLREAARRPLGVNLAKGLELSSFLSSFTGVLRRP